jgi:prevent-host-death family protein
MTVLNATEARANLYSLIDETAKTHQPIVITGKRTNAVLISEEDWNAISETIYLLSVPEMRESINLNKSVEHGFCGKSGRKRQRIARK